MEKNYLFLVEKRKTIILDHFPLSFGSFGNSSRGNFIQNLPWVFPAKFQLICTNGFREDFSLLANHKQELSLASMLVV